MRGHLRNDVRIHRSLMNLVKGRHSTGVKGRNSRDLLRRKTLRCNHYKALFVAMIGQQVVMAQGVSTVVCDANVQGSTLTYFFYFFCLSEGRTRPCLG